MSVVCVCGFDSGASRLAMMWIDEWSKLKRMFRLCTRHQGWIDDTVATQSAGQTIDQMGQGLTIEPGVFVKQLPLTMRQQYG